MKCSSLNLKAFSLVQDNYSFGLSPISQNSQNLFASSLQIKYENEGKITGIKFGF